MAEKTELEMRVLVLEEDFRTLRNNVAVVFGRVARDFIIHRERMEDETEKK